ncbi:MAG: hydrolase [Micrococcaceae bacterium]|nr:hydrolase [Micrococcaceae bacterium]
MTIQSAGILLYRRSDGDGLQVWIAHMGGPFWARKDAAAWSIPKGEFTAEEDPLAAARREFAEEMGVPAPPVDYALLGSFRQPSRKIITVFAAESDFQPDRIESNTFELEWPKGSGIVRHYPEIDAAQWFTASEARGKLVRGQLPILDSLTQLLAGSG